MTPVIIKRFPDDSGEVAFDWGGDLITRTVDDDTVEIRDIQRKSRGEYAKPERKI